ncbi:MAG TPA: hypothetical protein VFU04_09665, partial [Solirubrobacterales bacterium]|nr:hypothetical protein [Solirubrobacterales bacterium]
MGRKEARRSGRAGRIAGLAIALAAWFAVSCLGLAFATEVPPTPAPETAEGPTTQGSSDAGRALVELESRRTASSRTFALSNGSYETRIYQAPVHYREVDGQWSPIDETLRPDGRSALSNGANSFDLDLPARLGAGPVQLAFDGGWIAYELIGASSAPVESRANVARYATNNGVVFELSSLADGVKENIVLSDPAQPRVFHFAFDASPGVAPVLADDGSIEFREGDRAVAVLPAPVMYDSATAAPQVSEAVRYDLAPDGSGGWQLTVTADSEWLEAPQRVWPVVIDPSLTVPAPSLDCSYGGRPGENGWRACGTSTERLWASYAPHLTSSLDEWKRSALRFSLSAIPAGSYIDSAKV